MPENENDPNIVVDEDPTDTSDTAEAEESEGTTGGDDTGEGDASGAGEATLKDEEGWRRIAAEAELKGFGPVEFRQRVVDAQGLEREKAAGRFNAAPPNQSPPQSESFPTGQEDEDMMTHGQYRAQRRLDLQADEQRRLAEEIKVKSQQRLYALNSAKARDKSLQDPLTLKYVEGLLDAEMAKGYSAPDAVANLTRDANRMKARGGKQLVDDKLKQKRRTPSTEGAGGSSSGSKATTKPQEKPQDNDILGGHALQRTLEQRGLA